jgi:hypothetical protein
MRYSRILMSLMGKTHRADLGRPNADTANCYHQSRAGGGTGKRMGLKIVNPPSKTFLRPHSSSETIGLSWPELARLDAEWLQ